MEHHAICKAARCVDYVVGSFFWPQLPKLPSCPKIAFALEEIGNRWLRAGDDSLLSLILCTQHRAQARRQSGKHSRISAFASSQRKSLTTSADQLNDRAVLLVLKGRRRRRPVIGAGAAPAGGARNLVLGRLWEDARPALRPACVQSAGLGQGTAE